MSWCSKWLHGSEWPEGVEVTLGHDGNVQRYVPEAENAKLREQMERLVTLLRVDCDIDASWDGLRRFWSIELTESGCLMRDRACRAEAENAKLRELVGDMCEWAYVDSQCDLQGEFADHMRELGIEVER